MKKYFAILCALFFFMSCNKEKTITEVTFTCNISGFIISTHEFGGLKSQKNLTLDFVHKYPPGTLEFTNSDGIIYTFQTGSVSVDNFSITLPVGSYTISGFTEGPDPSGRNVMSFNIPSQTVIISESTIKIDLSVSPTCSLVIVYDEQSLVSSAYIRDVAYQLTVEGTLHFNYFNPRDPLFIIKTNGAILTIPTNTMQIGYIYQIVVTDSGTTQTLDLSPVFTEYGIITW